MASEVAGRRERLGAFRALVWFVRGVCQLVVVEIGAGGERLAAEIAGMRLFAAVDAAVGVER